MQHGEPADCTPAHPHCNDAVCPQTSCKSCSPGYFARANGATACEAAPEGSFVAEAGAVVATPCPNNTYSSTNASSACQARGWWLGGTQRRVDGRRQRTPAASASG